MPRRRPAACAAISFGGTGGNLLVLENAYDLVGSVSVAGAANTLELLGAAGAVTVDFDKSGAGFSNFATVAFGASSNHKETLAISNSAVLPGEISGFTQRHDIVDRSGQVVRRKYVYPPNFRYPKAEKPSIQEMRLALIALQRQANRERKAIDRRNARALSSV